MRIVKATLVKTRTDDGLCEIWETVKVGAVYAIDLDSIRENAELYNVDRRVTHHKTIVDARQPCGHWRWLPIELLRVETDG